jgi:hypothetical protein
MGLSKSKCSVIIILIAVLGGACGYRFGGESGFPGDSDRLFVKVLENRTQETGVENIVTAALLSELTLRKTDGLASGIDHADVVLSGVVEEVAIRTIRCLGSQRNYRRRRLYRRCGQGTHGPKQTECNSGAFATNCRKGR